MVQFLIVFIIAVAAIWAFRIGYRIGSKMKLVESDLPGGYSGAIVGVLAALAVIGLVALGIKISLVFGWYPR